MIETRTRRVAPVVAGVLALVLVALVAALATRPPSSDRLADSPLLGRVAPALAGPSVMDGEPALDFAPDGERFTLVNFFATWCVPCQAEHDDLVRFSLRHAQSGMAEVLSVVFSDEPADVARFFVREGGDWPVIDDDDGAIATAWGVTGVPESYLVDPDGVVVAKIVGGVSTDGLEDLLARAVSS